MDYGLVSVIMPTYNCGRFIRESIQSVLAQTYSQWELVVVDDCSTDDTESIVSSFADNRIRYYRNEQNCGAAITRNRALREAQGRWIAFLDSDDLWLPTKLEKQIAFMQRHRYAFSYHNYQEIDEQGQLLGKTVSGPRHITRVCMYAYCWPGCLTVMYKRDTMPDLQIPNIRKNNDYAMWLLLSKYADCYLLQDTLAYYRRRKGSISNQNYFALIRWHYLLFRSLGKSKTYSCYNTCINLLCGLYKKIRYISHL